MEYNGIFMVAAIVSTSPLTSWAENAINDRREIDNQSSCEWTFLQHEET